MRNKKGISLIVLVITIIVMVILVGAVVMTLDNTGITNQSKKAKNKTNYAQEITRLEVMKNGILTDNLGKITVAEYIAELTSKGIIEGTVTDNADGSKTFTTDTGAEVTVTQNGERDLLIEIAGYTDGNISSGDNITTPVNTFTFTVDGVTYYAEEGMNWEEWTNSSYNTAGFILGECHDGNRRMCSRWESTISADVFACSDYDHELSTGSATAYPQAGEVYTSYNFDM